MQILTIKLLALLAAASTAAAVSQQEAHNQCPKTLYAFFNGSGTFEGPITVPSGSTLLFNITGEGNSLALAKSTDYYSSTTPKFVLGTSTSDGTLYW